MPNIAGTARRRAPSRSEYCALQPAHERLRRREPDRPRSLIARSTRRRRAGSIPVISAAAGEAANSTARGDLLGGRRAARAGSARARRRGTPGRRGTARSVGVATNVGATATTRMPRGASSTRERPRQPLDRVLGRAVDAALAARRRGPSARRRRRSRRRPRRHARAPRRWRGMQAGAHVERPQARRPPSRSTLGERLRHVRARGVDQHVERVERRRRPPRARAASVTSHGDGARRRRPRRATARGDRVERRPRRGRAARAGAAPAAANGDARSRRRCRGSRP